MLGGLLLLVALSTGRAWGFDQDHSAWQRLLELRLRGGLVDYEGLRADPDGLDAYLLQLAQVEPGDYTAWTPEDRLTFWINAVNAFAVKNVVDHYPFKRSRWRSSAYQYPANSIKQARDFENSQFTAVGEFMTLAEARALTESLSDDPRLAFALTCPCQGGPPLPAQAFRASDLDAQLDAAARSFANDPRRVSVDERTHVLRLSPVLRKARIGPPIAFLQRYLKAEAVQALNDPGWTLEWVPFDWSLDELGSREAH